MNTTEGDAPGLVDDAEGSLVGPDDSPHVTASAESGSWWTGLRGFWASAALLLILLLALVPVVNNGHIAWPDDGVYAAQVKNLAKGSWSSERPVANLDADGANSAIIPSFVYSNRQIPYDRHPLFPLVLVPFYAVGGFVGLSIFSVLGTWGAAVAAGLLARRFRPVYGLPALLLTGLTSPLIYDAYLVSAHAAAAAFTGFAVLGATQVIDDRRWLPLVYALPSCALVVALRSEGLLAMAALGIVVGATALVSSVRSRRIAWQPFVVSGAVLVTTVATYLADSRWRQHIESASGGKAGALLQDSTAGSRGLLSGMWAGLFRPWFASELDAKPALALGAVSIVLASIVLKAMPRRWLLPVALLGFGCAALLLQQFLEVTLVTGLFAAFPLLVAGLIQLTRSDIVNRLSIRLLGTAAIASAAIVATAYADGGAVQWGGRFYHLLLPLLIPLVVIGFRRGAERLPRTVAPFAVALVIVISLSTSIFALRAQVGLRASLRDLAKHTVAFADRHSIGPQPSGRPLIVVGTLYGDGTGRAFWNSGDRADVLVARGAGDIFRIVERAKAAGYQSVTVVSNLSPPLLAFVATEWLKESGWDALTIKPALNTPFILYEFGEPKK